MLITEVHQLLTHDPFLFISLPTIFPFPLFFFSFWKIFIWVHQVLVVAHGIFVVDVGSFDVARRLSCCITCGISLPWPGIKPMSPAFEGKFLTIGSQGKSHISEFYRYCNCPRGKRQTAWWPDCSHAIKCFILSQYWKVVPMSCEWHQDSWPAERNSIQGRWQGLISQSFCVVKFY